MKLLLSIFLVLTFSSCGHFKKCCKCKENCKCHDEKCNHKDHEKDHEKTVK